MTSRDPFFALLWKGKKPPVEGTPEINTEQMRDLGEGIKAAGGLIEEVKKVAEITQPKAGEKPSETFDEANKILEGAKSFSDKINPAPQQTPSAADSIRGVKDVIQESKALAEELGNKGKERQKERYFNVTDEGQIFADPAGDFSFKEALQIASEKKRESSTNAQKYYYLDPVTGEVKEMKGPTVIQQPQPPEVFYLDDDGNLHQQEGGKPMVLKPKDRGQRRFFNVDDDGNVFRDDDGDFSFSEAIQISRDRRSERKGNGAPSVYQLKDKDGNQATLSKESLDAQIAYWKAIDGMKYDEEKHEAAMGVLGEVQKNVGPGIAAIKEGLSNRHSSSESGSPVGSKGNLTCASCGKVFDGVNARRTASGNIICPHCRTELEVIDENNKSSQTRDQGTQPDTGKSPETESPEVAEAEL